MNIQKKAQRFLPLTESTYCILASLSEPCHGYRIMQRVEKITSGRITLGPGTLYGALTKLMQQRLIRRVEEEGQNEERRKKYILTELGHEVTQLETRRLADLVTIGESLLKKRSNR